MDGESEGIALLVEFGKVVILSVLSVKKSTFKAWEKKKKKSNNYTD